MEFKLLTPFSSSNNGKSPECDFDENGINLKLSLATPSSVDLNLCLQPATVTIKSCQVCECTKTPFWRRGPNGSKTLCNACGLQYRKFEQRRKAFLAEGVPVWYDKEIDYEFAKLIGENPDRVYFVGGNSQGDN